GGTQEVSAPSHPTSLVPVPYAESLLHADCAGEEVTCEISPYSLHLADEGPSQASWFMGTLKLSSGISIALVLKVSSDSEEDDKMAVLHPRLKVPVSKEGTVLTTVEFQLSSRTPTLRTRFGTSVTLDCRFALASSSPLASMEWRLQHRGSGRRVFHYQTGEMAQAEQSTAHHPPISPNFPACPHSPSLLSSPGFSVALPQLLLHPLKLFVKHVLCIVQHLTLLRGK
uniref:TAP binding protein like n=1 Tax=Chelonoidis abingdonii TaxID=106734 RepID=A0A8C0HCJ2_CHEAB